MAFVQKFDLQIARGNYDAAGYYIPAWKRLSKTEHKNEKISTLMPMLSDFGAYSPAYAGTNEDWRAIIRATRPNGKNILATNGSGDIPVAFRTFGAANIDTFDISYFAHVVTNIKTAAANTLAYQEYKQTLESLHNATRANDIANYSKIAKQLSPKVKSIITGMNGCHIFCNGCGAVSKHIPSEQEYNIAHGNIKNFDNFIWSDITELHNHIDTKYDLIYVSNIFDYFRRTPEKISETANSLEPFLSPNGQIVICSPFATQMKSALKSSKLNQITQINDVILAGRLQNRGR